jgi:prevent-host-death family protein
MAIVSSAEVQKNFGRYKDAALGEPVVVTQYGKPAVVILAAAEYERLKELDRRVMRLDTMSDGQIEEMLEATIPPEHQYRLDDIPD